MALPLKPGVPPDLAALRETAQRLLERTLLELHEGERPLARLAGERCTAHLAECFEQVAAAPAAATRLARLECIDGALRALAAARADLDLLRALGAVLPTGARTLLAGIEVLRRGLAAQLPGSPPGVVQGSAAAG